MNTNQKLGTLLAVGLSSGQIAFPSSFYGLFRIFCDFNARKKLPTLMSAKALYRVVYFASNQQHMTTADFAF